MSPPVGTGRLRPEYFVAADKSLHHVAGGISLVSRLRHLQLGTVLALAGALDVRINPQLGDSVTSNVNPLGLQTGQVDTGVVPSQLAVDVVENFIFEHFNEIIEPKMKLGVFLDI